MRGFLSIELLISMTIVALVTVAALAVALELPSSIRNGVLQVEAGELAAGTLLSLGRASANFGSLRSSTFVVDPFTVTLDVTAIDAYTKKIVETIRWNGISGENHSLTQKQVLADSASSPTCTKLLIGDWKHPVIRTLPTPLPFASFATENSVLAATATTSPNATSSVLFFYSLASTTNPILISSMDTASTTRRGLAALAMKDGYAYAATALLPNYATCVEGPACSQLAIIDVHDPYNPSAIRYLQLATSSPPYASGSNGQSSGKSIVYANGYVYLGLQKGTSQTEEFNVIDVHDPVNPLWLGGYQVGHTITKILVLQNIAYITTDDPGNELIALDIADPAHIRLASTFNAPGNQLYGYAHSLDYIGNLLALVRTYSPDGPEFALVSTLSSSTATTSLTQVGSIDLSNALHHTSAYDVLSKDHVSFVLTDNALQMWDTTDPAKPSAYASDILLPGTGIALGCAANTLYASSYASTGGGLTTMTAL